MICRPLVFLAIAAAVFAAPRPGSAEAAGTTRRPAVSTRWRAASQQTIRRTPILSRPNRPGHFVGNSIRRSYSRRGYGR